jgi:hypothetical protein
MWIWFICCGIVMLSVSRFFIRHSVPLPELWLLSFPFLFEVFFQTICPSAKVPAVDELLWAFDANFGTPQRFLGTWLIAAPPLLWLCKMVWLSLPVLFVVVYLLLPESVRRRYLAAVAATGCIILPLYALCPAAGPVYLFGEHYAVPGLLPVALPNPHATLLSPGLALNTTPSGHVAWALLLFWFCQKYCRRRVAAAFGFLAAVMILATLGLGEHYAIDLILSAPYAAAIWSLIERRWKRSGLILTVVAGWLIALREGWALKIPHPAVWLACALTICLPLVWREDTQAGSLASKGAKVRMWGEPARSPS